VCIQVLFLPNWRTDLDTLRNDKRSIRREEELAVPPLVAGGGCMVLVDGLVRLDVPIKGYVYYRRLLEVLVGV
jgi:hypothetical protein